MPELHVVSAWAALALVIPALWGTLFSLSVGRHVRWIFVFLIALGVWGAARMAYWDILPSLVHLDQWAAFADAFGGPLVNAVLNIGMGVVSAYAIWARYKMDRK